jgi:hypothetical protein
LTEKETPNPKFLIWYYYFLQHFVIAYFTSQNKVLKIPLTTSGSPLHNGGHLYGKFKLGLNRKVPQSSPKINSQFTITPGEQGSFSFLAHHPQQDGTTVLYQSKNFPSSFFVSD